MANGVYFTFAVRRLSLGSFDQEYDSHRSKADIESYYLDFMIGIQQIAPSLGRTTISRGLPTYWVKSEKPRRWEGWSADIGLCIFHNAIPYNPTITYSTVIKY